MSVPEVRTVVSILGLTLVVAVWAIDLYCVQNGYSDASVSAVILSNARAHPILSFAAGILMGHLFWPQ